MPLLESLRPFNLNSKFLRKSKSGLFLLSIIEVLLDSIIYQALPAFKGYGFWIGMEGVKKMS